MASVDLLVKAWGEAQWEFSLAFDGLADDKVWERPHPSLLSIGELAGHVAYNEAMMTHYSGTERAPSADDISLKSPLINSAFNYYTNNIDAPVRLETGAEEVKAEVARVHAAVRVEPR